MIIAGLPILIPLTEERVTIHNSSHLVDLDILHWQTYSVKIKNIYEHDTCEEGYAYLSGAL